MENTWRGGVAVPGATLAQAPVSNGDGAGGEFTVHELVIRRPAVRSLNRSGPGSSPLSLNGKPAVRPG